MGKILNFSDYTKDMLLKIPELTEEEELAEYNEGMARLNAKLEAFTEKEKWGCLVLWLNALYAADCLGEPLMDLPDSVQPCWHCPRKHSCPTTERFIPIALVFKSLLEPITGRNTVVCDNIVDDTKSLELLLEGISSRLYGRENPLR